MAFNLKDHDIVKYADLRDSQDSEDSKKSKGSDQSAHAKVCGHQQATRQSTVSGDSQSSGESVQVGIHHPIGEINHPQNGFGNNLQVGKIVLDVTKLDMEYSRKGHLLKYVEGNKPEESHNHTQHEEEKGSGIKYKCLILLVVLVISIAGITVTIHFLKETYPDAFSGFLIDKDAKIYENPIKTVLLGDERTFTFHIDRIVAKDITVIHMSTPITDNEGDEISVPYSFGKVSKRSSDDWIASYNPNTQMMTITGPPAKCSSSGPHIVKFMNDVFVIIDTISVHLDVKSDVGQTTLSLEQNGDLNVNQFTCVYRHGCQRSDLQFVVDIDDEDIIYNGINSSSTVTFNETKGFVETYKINMTKTLEQKANHVKCQSIAKTNSTDDINSRKASVSILPLKAVACDIDNGCEFKCDDRYGNNYYAVDQLRCDKFYRCYNDNIFSYNCPSGTFFDSSPNVCTCGFKKDLPWCNGDGSLKEDVDVSEEVCGNTLT